MNQENSLIDHKQTAVQFLKLVVSGHIDEAYTVEIDVKDLFPLAGEHLGSGVGGCNRVEVRPCQARLGYVGGQKNDVGAGFYTGLK